MDSLTTNALAVLLTKAATGDLTSIVAAVIPFVLAALSYVVGHRKGAKKVYIRRDRRQ
jgi:hypothetical protein